MSAASGMAPRPKDFLFRVRMVAAVTEVSVWPEGKDAPKGRRSYCLVNVTGPSTVEKIFNKNIVGENVKGYRRCERKPATAVFF